MLSKLYAGVDPTPRDRVAAELVPGGRKRPEVPEPRDVFERAVRCFRLRLRRERARATAGRSRRRTRRRTRPGVTAPSVHLQNFPEKSCTPRIANTKCWNSPNRSTSTIFGNASASDAPRAASEPLHQPQRPQRARDEGADRRERVRAREHRQHGSRATAPSTACHGSRAYAPGCAMKPMATIFTKASHEKNVAKATSRCESARPRLSVRARRRGSRRR